MAIALSGTTPAAVDLAASTSATAVTASFSPPAGSLVAVGVALGYTGGGPPTVTVADSLANSYAAGPSGNDAVRVMSFMFSYYYAAAPGSVTVTATRAGNTTSALFEVVPWVLTGAAASQAGAASSFQAGTSSGTVEKSLTATATGSWVLVTVCMASTEASFTPAGLSTDHSDSEATDVVAAAAGHAVTVAPGAATLGWTVPTATTFAWSALEILPAVYSTNTTPAYATNYDTTAVSGAGTWTNPAYAEGTGGSGGPWATWTAP